MTIEQANEILRSSEIAQDADDDFATYFYGPDDPEEYFSKIETPEELIEDFQEFRGVANLREGGR